MKKWIAAAWMLGLGACLENPGVDQGLATMHDRLSAEFFAPGAGIVRLRLERTAGGTELYLANRTDRTIDSLDFFAQVSDRAPFNYAAGIDADYPVFDEDPIAEFNGRIIGLRGGEEADLGPLTGAFPAELDRTGLIFRGLSEDTIANHGGDSHLGYYSGVFTAHDTTGMTITGTLRGLGSYSGFHFWMRYRDDEWGALNGSMRGDSVSGIRFTDQKSYAMLDAPSAALDARPDDSLEFSAALRNQTEPGNSFTLRVTLSRSAPRRWSPK
jgi:hypothetical protein